MDAQETAGYAVTIAELGLFGSLTKADAPTFQVAVYVPGRGVALFWRNSIHQERREGCV
jgi:hypothetical protein